MSNKRIIIDPITRIEGHLKIEVEIDNKNRVVDAWSSGTMARGFEKLLEGKDPRDAPFVTSRFCGVCFSVHQMASSLCLDAAFGARVPYGGRLLRQLVMGAQFLFDHLLHFYTLSLLDYVDIMAVAQYTGVDKELNAIKERLVSLVQQNDTFPLTPRYKPDEFCISQPDTVITLIKHYLDALKMHAAARKMGSIFGGRAPHYQSIVVGGMTILPDVNMVLRFKTMLEEQCRFIEDVYLPDVLALVTGPLLPLATTGLGAGHLNFLSYGSFPLDAEGNQPLFPAGVVIGLSSDTAKTVPFDQSKITEAVNYSWYKNEKPVHPSQGSQEFDFDVKGAYSFVKAPRYDGHAMEVGPQARMIIARNTDMLSLMEKHNIKPGFIARHLARAIETKLVCQACSVWIEQLLTEMTKPGFAIHDSAHWEPPAEGVGAGFYEAPRGALGHWIKIRNQTIEKYQAVVPSTWNASPRCNRKIRGQYEQALLGVPVADHENPINVVRVIRSFDPCLACAVHLIDHHSQSLGKFVVTT